MNDADRRRIDENNHRLAAQWQPASVFHFFADLSAIARGSGNTGSVADFLEAFAAKRHLEHERDAAGNVIIRKKGRKGKADGVILQAHQDMVCVKRSDADHDFKTDPVEFLDQGDGWLRAANTTLGADDGIGVALALAVLDDASLEHPPLEALFTVDEETDMKGIKAVKASSLKGDTLINLDAEDLNIAYVSSAAGATFRVDLPLRRESAQGPVLRRLLIDGLCGGHSGIEIHQARANAYVLLARFLATAAKAVPYALHSFEQGEGHGADNAIPDRAAALVSLASEAQAETLDNLVQTWNATLRNEYRASDPGLNLRLIQTTADAPPALDPASRDSLLDLVRLFPLGVWRFIQTEDLLDLRYGDLLVESSCNLGIVRTAEAKASLFFLARSCTPSVLEDYLSRAKALARLAGAVLSVTNNTSGWEIPTQPSRVQGLFKEQGVSLRGVHAGLECGCLIEAFEEEGRKLDAISVGPDLKDVHSPKERLHIGSVAELWGQLVRVLQQL
ncbi:beta-Ala-His dipeptidase [Desulfovibrio sp. OttesenSCG-928-F20]|nr:beta-Ala-His dipeptidase [Desulfovibrio sp. OttesenSCG-928-M16]MDL2291413.1 beta-Ala-His dipeptidase [Desulfovibrio sp. OttesenSCG-928-F20]